MGKMLANLPVDIQIGKMLVMASIFHIVEPVVAMAAALSVQSPFLSNLKCNMETMQSRKDLISDHGDPLSLLNAYNEWIQVKTGHHTNSGRWCKTRGLEEQRFYEISKLKRQFDDLLKENSLVEVASDSSSSSSDSESDRHGSSSKQGRHRKESYAEKQRKEYEKILEKKERKRLLGLKKEITMKPKRPKLLQFDVILLT